jgi:lipopolysaccharide transport system ATP-binding protein
MSTVIKAEGLGKRYLIRHEQQERYSTLSGLITKRMWAGARYVFRSFPYRRGADDRKGREHLWALKDVSFAVQQGETIGVIGLNGAGKSTLLKILSRITEPTNGRVVLRGRVASLLEVGTGFHPELTGRENIFLNGAVLGMTKTEIKARFDEIVAFSEVEKFLDTPVKRFSSGMYLRLAFAVAAHLQPEILLVDEVLAVGDGQFQKKCMGKMENVAREGRTVVFVSHNMSAVSALCARTLLIENGQLAADGKSDDVIAQYESSAVGIGLASAVELADWMDRYGPGQLARFKSVALFNTKSEPCRSIAMGEGLMVRLVVSVFRRAWIEVGLAISNMLAHRVTHMVSAWDGPTDEVDKGDYVYLVEIPSLSLVPGLYYLTIFVKRQGGINYGSDDGIERVLMFEVTHSSVGDKLADFSAYCKPGEVYFENHWTVGKA